MKPPGRAMPADAADLDALLVKGDELGLMRRLVGVHDAPGVGLDMNWEVARLYDGAGFTVDLAYVRDLWRMAQATAGKPPADAPPNADTADGLKQSAVAYALYAYELIRIDGARCADASAPAHRFDQLVSLYRPVWLYAFSLSAADREKVVRVALAVEAATAPVRKEDATLCSGGMSEMTQSLAAGQAPQPIPTPPGVVGKAYAVPPPPGYEPQFLPEAQWRPAAAATRAELEAGGLLKAITPKQPPVGSAPQG